MNTAFLWDWGNNLVNEVLLSKDKAPWLDLQNPQKKSRGQGRFYKDHWGFVTGCLNLFSAFQGNERPCQKERCVATEEKHLRNNSQEEITTLNIYLPYIGS